MTAPDIRGVRREIADAVELLHYVYDHLEDVHVLAYNRYKAAEAERVNGGSRDYALDNHGDPKARKLYADVAAKVHHTITALRGPVLDLRSHLTAGAGTVRRDPSADATVDEIIEQIEARKRRLARGEYEPALQAAQPQVVSQTEWRKECEALRSALRKATEAFREDHRHCTPEPTKRKLLRRYPMNALTPRERDAWRRAFESVRPADQREAS